MSPLNIMHNDENDTACLIAASVVSPKSSQRSSISFSPEVRIFNVLHFLDYSAEEKQATWCDGDEITSFKNEAKASAALMISGVVAESESAELCFRGLEARTRDGALRKRHNKIDARAAVFIEQELQQEEGVFDEEAIADVYYDCTQHCRASANMMGLRDEKHAQQATAVVVVKEERVLTALTCKTPSPVLGFSFNRVALNVAGPENMRRVSSSAA
jgi:hypothetical protein